MKKLNKLQINSEKMMKNDELLRLRGGGYDPLCCVCTLKDPPYTPTGYMVADGPWDCSYQCNYVNSEWYGNWVC